MEIPPIMLGTFQNRNYDELFGMVNAAVSEGFTGFDTAPSYKSEESLGKAIKEVSSIYGLKRQNFFISDKIDAWQMQEGNGDIQCFVDDAIKKMDIDYFDLLLIHWPIPEYLDKTWKSFEKLYNEGVVKNIGICNLRVRHLQKVINYNIPPQFVQIERHPLRTCVNELNFCLNHRIRFMSYSPMCQMDSRLKDNDMLVSIAKKYKKNVGQIILRWHLDTNSIPVFMSKSPTRVKDNLDIFDFSLTSDEISLVSSLNQNYKIFLESWGCLGF